MQLRSQLICEILEADARILIAIKAEHEPLKFSLSGVEAMFSKQVPKIGCQDQTLPRPGERFKDIAHIQVRTLVQTESEGLHLPLCSNNDSHEGLYFISGVWIEESWAILSSATVVFWSISDKVGILSAKGQNQSVEVLELDESRVCSIEAAEY